MKTTAAPSCPADPPAWAAGTPGRPAIGVEVRFRRGPDKSSIQTRACSIGKVCGAAHSRRGPEPTLEYLAGRGDTGGTLVSLLAILRFNCMKGTILQLQLCAGKLAGCAGCYYLFLFFIFISILFIITFSHLADGHDLHGEGVFVVVGGGVDVVRHQLLGGVEAAGHHRLQKVHQLDCVLPVRKVEVQPLRTSKGAHVSCRFGRSGKAHAAESINSLQAQSGVDRLIEVGQLRWLWP